MPITENRYMIYPNNLETQNTKRRRSFDYTPELTEFTREPKKLQHFKLHSEIHNYTVETMMKSQKLLQERERLQRIYQVDDGEEIFEEDMTEQQQYHQAPFWPVINKIKN